MDNFSDKIMAILNNPEGLESIMSIAKSLGGKDKDDKATAENTNKDESISNALMKIGEGKKASESGFDLSALEELFNHNKSNRLELLKALKPYIKPDKQGKIDNIMSAMKTIDLIYSAKNLL